MTTIKGIKRLFARPARLGLMAAAGLMAGGALADGFDGLTLVTNAWFAADFTRLTADTVISQGDTTGITSGAGSWTAVPTTGTAQIAADADAGGEATLLSINAEEGELTFTPAALATATGMATVTVDVKTIAVDTLPTPEGGAQGAFAIYSPDGEAHSLAAYVSDGTAGVWTNLVYAAGADTLTNAWFALTLDFATVSNVRYVRYSITPPAGSLTILADTADTQWFRSADDDATTVASVSFTGTGNIRTFSGKELQEAVATYNGVNYETFETAIAAGVADSWAHGNVRLLADATWTPTATGAYNIDVNGNELTINGVNGTWSGTTYTVPATHWYWIGGASSEWANGANWSHFAGGSAANAYPSNYSVDEATVAAAATITLPSSNADVSNLYVNANVSLVGGKIRAKAISGSGKLTMLDGTTFYASEGSTVSVDVEIPSGATVNADTSAQYAGFTFSSECALTGSGTIQFKGSRPSYPLYWDASGFSGTVVVVQDSQTRNNTTIRSTSATHERMTWQIVNSSAGDTGFITQEGTYKFGSLSGTVYMANSKGGGYGYVKGVIMEVGALNGDDVLGGQVARTAGRANDGAYIRKVGTGVLSSSVKGVNGYYIQGGVLNIASDDGLSVKDDNSNPGTDIVFEGGVLRIAEGVTKDASAYIAIGTSTSPVAFDDEGRNHVWNTALGASLTGGLTKKGSGTLTLAAAPAYTGTTTLEGGILVVPQGTTIAALSIIGGKLTVPLTGTENETTVLNITALAVGTDYDMLTNAVAIPGTTVAVESDGGSGYIVKATRTPQTFTWTGAVDTDWATPGNWSVGGVVAESLPIAVDTVLFPASESTWEVSLAADAVASNVVFESDTEISAGSFKLTTVEISGAGTLTAKGLKLVSPSNEHLAIRAPIEIPVGYVFETATGTQYKYVYLYSKVTGSGEWKMNQNNNNQRAAVQFHGDLGADMSEFSGTLTVINATSSIRDQTGIWGSIASSSNAVWNLVGFSKTSDDSSSLLKNAGTTYYFGALNGYVCASGSQTTHNKNTWEIGAREDANSVLSGNFFQNTYHSLIESRSDTIRKVGAGSTLTFSGSRVRAYEANAGVLKLASANALLTTWDGGSYAPSIAFNGGTLKLDESVTLDVSTNIAKVASTSAIAFDDEGIDRTWEVALPGTGGLVKKGDGTLTLTAVPLYTGLTTVEEGTLVVEAGEAWTGYTLGANTKVTIDGTTYTFAPLSDDEKPEADENGVITVPPSMDGATAAYAIAPGQTIDCSLLTTASGIKAVVTTTVGGTNIDMTSYYTPASLMVNDGTITPQLSKEEVGVEFGDNVEEPVVFASEKPTFKLKNSVKKGLYYSVGTISDPSEANPDVTVVVEAQATADGEAISLEVPSMDFSGGNVLYYKLSVSDTAQKNE